MHLKLKSGIVGKGLELSPGDVVEWQDDDDARRLIETNLATKATKEEIQTASGKIRTYIPPKPRPEDRWPPQLKKLKSGDKDVA